LVSVLVSVLVLVWFGFSFNFGFYCGFGFNLALDLFPFWRELYSILGVENVRGGIYSKVELTQAEKLQIRTRISHEYVSLQFTCLVQFTCDCESQNDHDGIVMQLQNGQERFKATEQVMIDRNKFSDVEEVIKAMKEKENETALQLLPKFSTVEGIHEVRLWT
jgi:hypothetical protein